MSRSPIACTLLCFLLVVATIGCGKSGDSSSSDDDSASNDNSATNNDDSDPDNGPESDNSNDPQEDRLAGVVYPKAVVAFGVGNESSQEISEGLHFAESKRERGSIEHNVDGAVYLLEWTYEESDEQSDNYQFSITMPSEPETPIVIDISYSGAESITVLQVDDVLVKIRESMSVDDDD